MNKTECIEDIYGREMDIGYPQTDLDDQAIIELEIFLFREDQGL